MNVSILTAVCVLAGGVVLVEAFNKLERTDLSRKACAWRSRLEQLSEFLRAAGWFCLLLAGGGVIFAEQMPREYLAAGYMLAVVGSACLVIRARLQEHCGPAASAEAFDRTQVMVRPSSSDRLRAALRASMAIDADVNRAAGERARANAGREGPL